MVKSPIKVFVRTRPATVPSKNLLINEKERWINLNVPKKETRGHINHQIENWGFRFDGILTDSSQENVFDRIARDTVTSALEGYSGTIFCYGQTGAGKTFTMSGSTSSYKQRGIIPRTISALFQEIKLRAMERVEVKISYLEIYNEVMLDLLTTSQENITINEDRRGGVVLKGLSQITCEREDEGLNLFFEGEINKSTSQHNCNKSSSRAHSIFTLYIKSKAKVGMNERTVYSKINLVDLAGSERTKKTGSEGQTLIEANYINKSLSFLQQVVCALSEKQREHVPYRQSKLTNLLKDSIGGNCKTIMIANIWPEASNLEETISTLKFATSIKKVSNEAIANVFVNPLSPPRGYDVSGRNSAVSLDQTDYKPLTREEKEEQHIIAKKFLNGKLEDIEIKSIGQVKELFNQFKGMYQNLVDATKGYFHLLPENKLEELGIEADMYPRGQYCIRETVEGNDEVRSRKKRSKVVSMDNSFSQEQEEQEQSFNGEQRQGRAHTRLMDCLRVEEHDEDDALDKKLLKGLAGMIRQRSQAKRETEQKMRAMQSKTVSYQVDQEQNLEEEDVFEKDMHTEHDYTQDIKEIKERFKEHTEKINELKSTILSADQNIKRSRSLVVEKIEEILHPNQLYAQSSVKSKFQGNMMPNFGYMSTRNSDAPRNLY